MKYGYRNAALSALLVGASIAIPGSAVALDLNGAWASDADNCAKVFVRKGAQVSFADMSDEQLEVRYRALLASNATTPTKPPEGES